MNPDQPGGTVLVGGASGLIGTRLREALLERGTTVRSLVRREPRSESEVRWDPTGGVLPDRAFDGVGCVVVLSGAGVGDRRWTERYRRELIRSRTASVSLIAAAMARLGSGARLDPGTRLVVASAVGIYGDRHEEILTEEAPPGRGFLADLCVAWERAADPAREAGLAVAHARTGLVLDPAGGALRRLLPLLRLGLGGPMGSGRQWWPWITLQDEVRALIHLVDSDVTGPVNLTAPEPERNRDLVRALAAALHRPAVVPVPAWALRLAVGGFGGELVASQRAVPTALLRSGFEFTAPTIVDAADQLLS